MEFELLPYSEEYKEVIENHVLALGNAFTHTVATFNYKDGCRVKLLRLEGNFDMSYEGSTFEIPVVMWLMESYPRTRPRVYLQKMIHEHRHRHTIKRSGLVSTPYLRSWTYPHSNLVDVVRDLTSHFSQVAGGSSVDALYQPSAPPLAPLVAQIPVPSMMEGEDPKKFYWRSERERLIVLAREILYLKQIMESDYADLAIDEMISDLHLAHQEGAITLDKYTDIMDYLHLDRLYYHVIGSEARMSLAPLASSSTTATLFPSTIEIPSADEPLYKVVLQLTGMIDEETVKAIACEIWNVEGVFGVKEDMKKLTITVLGQVKVGEVIKEAKKAKENVAIDLMSFRITTEFKYFE